MVPVSVVIITKNEEENIAACIASAAGLSGDIIVVDSGSTDNTVPIAVAAGARVIEIDWICYGHSRNTGAEAARHDWIIAMDADERLTPALRDRILHLQLHENNVYRFRRQNHYLGSRIRFGTPGHDKPVRLYHRLHGKWNMNLVHEKLVTSSTSKILNEPMLHFSIRDVEQYREKTARYAELTAHDYFMKGRSNSLWKRLLSPVFNAAKSYIFELGFLDGYKGFAVAAIIARYSWLKYVYLHRCIVEAESEQAGRIVFTSPAPQQVLQSSAK
ncbi:MAG TPA: glycosyltransferase family 2 protein [Flavisolibacter sp.]